MGNKFERKESICSLGVLSGSLAGSKAHLHFDFPRCRCVQRESFTAAWAEGDVPGTWEGFLILLLIQGIKVSHFHIYICQKCQKYLNVDDLHKNREQLVISCFRESEQVLHLHLGDFFFGSEDLLRKYSQSIKIWILVETEWFFFSSQE